jgi:uncharacterized protein YkwD
MGVGRRARGGSRSGHSRFLRFALAGVLGVSLLALATGVTARQGSGVGPIRIVLSSSAATAPARRVSTKALYAWNDPWKTYLASERVCPGGERTDLPPKRQAEAVACLVNFARARRGLRGLAVASILNGASARKGRAILRCGRFAHNPCGGDWTASVRSTGYSGAFGENLYLASGPFAAPRVAVDAWLNSAPHRENLFRANWREQGLALVFLPRFGGSVHVSVWVNVLGDRRA